MISLLGVIASGYQSPVGISLNDRTRTERIAFSFVNGTSYGWDLPASAIAGDLVLAFLGTDVPFDTSIFGTPSGWTQHFNWASTTADNTGQLFTKVIDSTDVSSGVISIPCIQSATGRDSQCWTMIGTGIDTTTPVSDVGSVILSQGNPMTINGITPTADGLAVGFWGFDGGDGEPTTITSGWTKLEEKDADPSLSGCTHGFGSINSTSGVSTGNLVVTFQNSDGYGGVIVNLKAA